jgi:alanine racemase
MLQTGICRSAEFTYYYDAKEVLVLICRMRMDILCVEAPAMSSVEAPRKIVLRDKETVNEIAAAMKKRETFIIATDDPNFNPLGYDRHSAEVWLGQLVAES